MGIPGLMTLVRGELSTYAVHRELSLHSSSFSSPSSASLSVQTVIVDGNGFVYWAVSEAKVNCVLANYWELSLFVQRWCERCLAGGIRPVFVFDGPTEISKLQCKLQRNLNQANELRAFIEFSQNNASKMSSTRYPSALPLLAFRCVVATVQKLTETIFAPGEADVVLVRLADARGAVGIVSNDSDLLVYQRCGHVPVIPFWALGFCQDNSVQAYLFSPERIASIHKVAVEDLPLLAALLGNDDYSFAEVSAGLYQLLFQWKTRSQATSAGRKNRSKRPSSASSKRKKNLKRKTTNLRIQETEPSPPIRHSLESVASSAMDEVDMFVGRQSQLISAIKRDETATPRYPAVKSVKVALDFLCELAETRRNEIDAGSERYSHELCRFSTVQLALSLLYGVDLSELTDTPTFPRYRLQQQENLMMRCYSMYGYGEISVESSSAPMGHNGNQSPELSLLLRHGILLHQPHLLSVMELPRESVIEKLYVHLKSEVLDEILRKLLNQDLSQRSEGIVEIYPSTTCNQLVKKIRLIGEVPETRLKLWRGEACSSSNPPMSLADHLCNIVSVLFISVEVLNTPDERKWIEFVVAFVLSTILRSQLSAANSSERSAGGGALCDQWLYTSWTAAEMVVQYYGWLCEVSMSNGLDCLLFDPNLLMDLLSRLSNVGDSSQSPSGVLGGWRRVLFDDRNSVPHFSLQMKIEAFEQTRKIFQQVKVSLT